MSNFSWGTRSKQNLMGIHPDLRKVCDRALELTKQDMTVIEGLRDIKRQKELVAKGFSKTMNSRHLTGHAVDIIPYPIYSNWNNYEPVQWDAIGEAMLAAAEELGVDLEWGYKEWGWDKPHYQLSWRKYPK